jgi:hypothetical protein
LTLSVQIRPLPKIGGAEFVRAFKLPDAPQDVVVTLAEHLGDIDGCGLWDSIDKMDVDGKRGELY